MIFAVSSNLLLSFRPFDQGKKCEFAFEHMRISKNRSSVTIMSSAGSNDVFVIAFDPRKAVSTIAVFMPQSDNQNSTAICKLHGGRIFCNLMNMAEKLPIEYEAEEKSAPTIFCLR